MLLAPGLGSHLDNHLETDLAVLQGWALEAYD